jgi:hypothetical protein
MKLTDYQQGQLLHIHFTGELKYRTDTGTRVPSAQWRKMIDALTESGYVDGSLKITNLGRAYLNDNHLSIKVLN